MPAMIPAPGHSSSYMPSAASGATSRSGLPGSSRSSTRSRGSSLPRATWRSRARSGPPSAALASLSRSCSTSARCSSRFDVPDAIAAAHRIQLMSLTHGMLVTINRTVQMQLMGGRDVVTRITGSRGPGTDPAQPAQVRPPLTPAGRRRTAVRRTGLPRRSASRTSAPPPVSAGPAIYRHFPNKEALLVELLVGISTRLLAGGAAGRRGRHAPPSGARRPGRVPSRLRPRRARPDPHPGPRSESAARSGPASGAPKLSGSTSRSGSRCCASSTADLDEADARLMAHAAFGLLNSTPHSTKPAGGKPAGLALAFRSAGDDDRRVDVSDDLTVSVRRSI